MKPRKSLTFAGMGAALAAAALALVMAPTALAAPANDNFVDAAEFPSVDDVGTTVDASKEVGEPAHAGHAGGRSVWYRWTAPADGAYLFRAHAHSLDLLLAVYTGSDVSSLVEVASNDDGPGTVDSEVRFEATEGTSYAFAVDSHGGKEGSFWMEWYPSPPNDMFAAAQVLTGRVGRIAGTTEGATNEPGGPRPWWAPTVWYAWTAPVSGTVKFRTHTIVGSRLERFFDPFLSVHTGTSVDALTTIAANDNDPAFGCCNSFVGFEAVAGTTYRIAVDGGPGASFALSWSPLVRGTAARDTLVGTPGIEEIRGMGGNDILRGLGGADVLIGGSGNDRSLGGSGNDIVIDKHGLDVLAGGDGIDYLNARDGSAGDILNGGPGRDRCVGNRTDIRRRCP